MSSRVLSCIIAVIEGLSAIPIKLLTASRRTPECFRILSDISDRIFNRIEILIDGDRSCRVNIHIVEPVGYARNVVGIFDEGVGFRQNIHPVYPYRILLVS